MRMLFKFPFTGKVILVQSSSNPSLTTGLGSTRITALIPRCCLPCTPCDSRRAATTSTPTTPAPRPAPPPHRTSWPSTRLRRQRPAACAAAPSRCRQGSERADRARRRADAADAATGRQGRCSAIMRGGHALRAAGWTVDRTTDRGARPGRTQSARAGAWAVARRPPTTRHDPARPGHPIRPPALLHGSTARRLGPSRLQPRRQRRLRVAEGFLPAPAERSRSLWSSRWAMTDGGCTAAAGIRGVRVCGHMLAGGLRGEDYGASGDRARVSVVAAADLKRLRARARAARTERPCARHCRWHCGSGPARGLSGTVTSGLVRPSLEVTGHVRGPGPAAMGPEPLSVGP
jgi:hypothetical protein